MARADVVAINPPPPPMPAQPASGLDAVGIAAAATNIVGMRLMEQRRLDHIKRYMDGDHAPPYTPKGASSEYRWLVRRAKDNFLPLIVSVISQNLHVDGFVASANVDDPEFKWERSDEWLNFEANRMISLQHGVHRACATYGAAYVQVLPGSMQVRDASAEADVTDKSVPVVTPFSPRDMMCLYEDPVIDEWPMFSVQERIVGDVREPGKSRRVVVVMDEVNRYTLVGGAGRLGPVRLQWPDPDDPILKGEPAIQAHDMGVCPVVRFAYEINLDQDGGPVGEIERLIYLQDQINFHTFNMMLAAQFSAFRQRYVSGMTPKDERGRTKRPFDPGVDRLWVAEDKDTKFGEFSQTDLAPYIEAREAAIRHMSTLAQVPPYHMLGALVNLSADALSAARDGLDRKTDEKKATLTDSWRNVFRLMSAAVNDAEGFADMNGMILWRDTSSRSFGATIDGLVKVSQGLGVPAEELWKRIPGASAAELAAWRNIAEQNGVLEELNRILQKQDTGGAMDSNPTPSQPFQAGVPANGLAAPAPAAPGSPAPDTGASGEPPSPSPVATASGNKTVEVPAHTRTMPDTPPAKKPPKRPGKPTGSG